MFIGREKELALLKEQFECEGRSAVLVYGKRRAGKSTLISEAAKSFNGVTIEHLCVRSTFVGNLELLSRSVSRALDLPDMHFTHLYDVFDFLKAQSRPVLIVLDEYQYLKQALNGAEVDSYMQAIIDSLPAHVKLVLCGSYITVMRELLEEGNPLFGRFSAIMHIEEFDYLDSSRFALDASPYEKVAYYAVFGGSPFALATLDYDAGVRRNVEKLLLPQTGVLRTHIESVMLKEIQRSFDVRILEALGNGKKRYSEMQSILGGNANGLLGKQLKSLMDMETIAKTCPVNRKSDKKKTFYEISDNLMRFYFAFVFGNESVVARLGEHAFYENEIAPRLTQFVSRRFERVVLQYFARLSRAGSLPGVRDFGTYWYDDPQAKANGEFDCALQYDDGIDFYECKYYGRQMKLDECREEERQVRAIPGVSPGEVGFACTGGFDFEGRPYPLIDGAALYDYGLLLGLSAT